MSLARLFGISLFTIAACSGPKAKSKRAVVEEPWGRAYSGTPDAWWSNWHNSLGSKPPFGPGTQFEIETLGPNGIRQTEVIEVISITAQAAGGFALLMKYSNHGMQYRSSLPSELAYTHTNPGVITARNEQLAPVTVPAGTFDAGRLYISEKDGNSWKERDEWVVPDLPVRVQTWSRPSRATDLYNPPADGSVPEGTVLTRLIRIDRK